MPDGSRGEYLAECMRWLVEWGDAMGAHRLVACDNSHVLLPVPNLIAGCDACPTNMRIPARRIATSGFKQAHYAWGMVGAEVIVVDTESCARAALSGKWSEDV